MLKFFSFILIIFLQVFNSHCICQYFEGIITYEDQFVSKTPNLKNFSHSFSIYIKDSNIKMPFLLEEIGYSLVKKNKQYFVNIVNETIKEDTSYCDTCKFYSAIKASKQRSNQQKILGYMCRKYTGIREVDNIKETTNFYLSDSLRFFSDFSFLLMKEMGVCLKITREFEIGTSIITAVKITPMKFEDKIFELPDYQISRVNMKNLSKEFITGDK